MGDNTLKTLYMERTFEAPRQVVFDYFTIPALVKTWWGPEGTVTEGVEIDLKIGGSCRWAMRSDTGQPLILTGTIKELIIPERIVMTNLWQGLDSETLITLEFHDLGSQTLLRLTHQGIASTSAISLYREGWMNTLARLDRQL